MLALQSTGVAAGGVQNARDLLEKDEQMKHRGFFFELEHPEVGQTIIVGQPFKLSEAPQSLDGRSPLIGEHNDRIFQGVLGMTEGEVNDAIVAGAIQ